MTNFLDVEGSFHLQVIPPTCYETRQQRAAALAATAALTFEQYKEQRKSNPKRREVLRNEDSEEVGDKHDQSCKPCGVIRKLASVVSQTAPVRLHKHTS